MTSERQRLERLERLVCASHLRCGCVRHDSSSRQFDNTTAVGAHLRLQAGSNFKELLYPIFKRETHLSMADGTIVVVVYGKRLSTNDGDVRVASDPHTHTHTAALVEACKACVSAAQL